VPPLPGRAAAGEDGRPRWDGQDLRAFTGTYGDYLLSKVSKVSPSSAATHWNNLSPASMLTIARTAKIKLSRKSG
jgi:hypothetical protein